MPSEPVLFDRQASVLEVLRGFFSKALGRRWELQQTTVPLMDDQVEEPSLPTYQTISAQLVLRDTPQLILVMEWLIVACPHGELFNVRSSLLCDAIGAGL